MKTLQALQAAGWTVAEQTQNCWWIERGGWVLEVSGKAPVATLTHIADWAPHGFEVARSVKAHEWPDDALAELMPMALGATTVGDFCGITEAPCKTS